MKKDLDEGEIGKTRLVLYPLGPTLNYALARGATRTRLADVCPKDKLLGL
jgi:hypothetical protein